MELSKRENLRDAIDGLREKVKRLHRGVPQSEIVRFSVEIDSYDPLLWLGRQTEQNDPLRVYWRSRDRQFEGAGVGAAAIIADGMPSFDGNEYPGALRRALSDHANESTPLRYYGGGRFSGDGSIYYNPDWRDFWPRVMVAPQFEMSREHGKTWLSCNVLMTGDYSKHLILATLADMDNLITGFYPPGQPLPNVIGRHDVPDPRGWAVNIATAIQLFDDDVLEKIVLARESTFRFDNIVDPIALMCKLRNVCWDHDLFFFQPDAFSVFVGATPERLYRRDGIMVQSEALAGTRVRGNTADEDTELGEELLNSEKDIREQGYVVARIKDYLFRLCEEFEFEPEPTLRKLPSVQHLSTEFRGTLKAGRTDQDLLEALHPTPAVGGQPRERAIEFIQKIEGFDRGWYAGPIGWVSPDAAEFSVAIRSGLVRGSTLTLYSGAGIVKGSDPESEWKEIENKMSNFLKVIGRK